MKDIKAIAGLTFKIVVGVKLGVFCADVVTGIISKLALKGVNKLKEKIELKIEDNAEEPHMEIKK